MQNGQQNKHLSWFKVENFKRFEAFEMENIGQFNLIFGDNNTGKTTVLEALLFDDENFNQFLSNLYETLDFRGFFLDDSNGRKIPSSYIKLFQNTNLNSNASDFFYEKVSINRNHVSFQHRAVSELTEKELLNLKKNIVTPSVPKDVVIFKTNRNSESLSIEPDDNKNEVDNYIPYIAFERTYDEDLADFYSEKIQNSTKRKVALINSLNSFIPEINDIEITTAYPKDSIISIRLKNNDSPIPLPMFGDGAKKLFRILVELPMCKHRRLMIDEIDTGIHYSRFKDFWKTILVAAKENDVQIFATTHNKEGLKYFYEALEELPDYQQNARCFTLAKIKDNSIKAYTQTYEQFEHALHYDIEIR